MPIRNRIAEFAGDIAEWRQDIHRNPELLFDTIRTAKLVVDKLKEFGVDEVHTGIAQNGVVAVINGKESASGRVIGLRADMDALPIEETTGLEYASANAGKMHACGHDGHTAMLLGAARYLAETRNFSGKVVLLFQPAEEGGGGGRVMVEEGILERFSVDEVYGMHNWPGLELGEFAIRPGAFFAATDEIQIKILGRGGHAAKPHEAADPIVASAQIISAIQSIASRNIDPVKEAVISITSIESSSKTHNVIPESVSLQGTIRTMDEALRDLAGDRLRALTKNIASAMGCEAECRITRGYPVTINAARETELASEAARAVAGTVQEAPLIMGAEDFSYMLNERPGAYILIGNGDSAPVHHPKYNFADEAIPAGVSYWAELVEQRLPLG